MTGKKLTYCLHCKRDTGNMDVHYVKSKNNREMMSSDCSVCGGRKSVFVKTKQKGKGVVDDFVANLPVELHLLGTIHHEPYQKDDKSLTGSKAGKTRIMEYAGPGTRYDQRYAKGERGINNLDHAAMYHDFSYKSKDPATRNLADSVLSKKAADYLKMPGLSLLDKIDGHIVEKAMKLIKRKV
jgi:hypothetical protein